MAGSMRALVKTRPGPGNVELREVPIPQVGPRDVLVEVKAASMCRSDLHTYNWSYWGQRNITPPVILGHEFCGEVVEIGELVSQIKVGDLVSAESHITCGQCLYCRSEQLYLCPAAKTIGINCDGAFAEFVSVPAQNLWINPPDLPVELATIQEPFGNAAHAALAHDLVGRYVLVTGCGPLGLMAIAIAKVSGADMVIATDLVSFRRELAEQVGADLTLDPNMVHLVDEVIQATGGQGVDVLLEMPGATEAISQGISLVRRGGRVTLMGIPTKPAEIDLWEDVISKGLIIYGAVGRLTVSKWDRVRSMLHKGTINLMSLITHKLPLQEFERGLGLLRSKQCGKVMLLPSGKTGSLHRSTGRDEVEASVFSIETLPALAEEHPRHDPNLDEERRRLLDKIRDKRLYAVKQEVECLSDHAAKKARNVADLQTAVGITYAISSRRSLPAFGDSSH